MHRVAILIVNGFDRRGVFGDYAVEEARLHPWISLCLRQIERHTRAGSYDVLVCDNSDLPEHRAILASHRQVIVVPGGGDWAHHDSLDHLAGLAEDYDYLLSLDSDALPVRTGWLEELTARLDSGARLAGIWRDEMEPTIRAFVHVSCLALRRTDFVELRDRGISFARGMLQDVGQNLTVQMQKAGHRIDALRRSNAWNPHFLLGGLYSDLIYHQGAGSRQARFWTSTDPAHDEAVRISLRDAAFTDLDRLVATLRGETDPRWLSRRALGFTAPDA